jgi:LuxR family maltose regulon positive regulatory protein
VVSRAALFGRLGAAGRVTEVSAPPGSGKTLLLRSWIAHPDLAGRAAWVPVQPEERDPQRFWISVADALRETTPGSALIRPLTAAPDLDGWAIVERLLADLGSLQDRVWLAIDDAHELRSTDALRQLELLLMRTPPQLRFVLATRHDLRLGLHRLRLEGELTEIRAAELRFTLDEARALFEAAGVQLPDTALALLYQRAEGWAAGLRLAALSLSRHSDPARFATEFSGSERTVAEYLLAEVLERQSEEVRRLLLRTSVLERVSGELADLMTGRSGGERVLQDLEQAGAFVVSLDARRSWFRYHRMFADLLQLELRRTAPGELPALHAAAAGWYAEHGHPVEAIRHAQAAQDWDLAARLLADHWVNLVLDGQSAAARELLAAFPAGAVAADAELTALVAFDELNRGSLEEAERYLARAARVPAERTARLQVLLAIVRLALARQRGDLPAVVEEVRRLFAPAEAADAEQFGLGEDLRALALISLGIAEVWADRMEDADRHLEQGVALGRRIGRPYLELTGLAHWAQLVSWRSFPLGGQRGRQAIELAGRHGWTDEPIAGVAYLAAGMAMVTQGRLEEGERSLEHAERTLRAELEPAAGMRLHYARGLLEFLKGHHDAALGAFQTAERLAAMLVSRHTLALRLRSHLLQTLVRMGDTQQVEQALAEMDGPDRGSGEIRNAIAVLRLAQDDPKAATIAIAPVIDGSVPLTNAHLWVVQAFLLEAIARDALGDRDAAGRALERALDSAEPQFLLLPFLFTPAPELLERHSRHGTAHAALISAVLNELTGRKPEVLSSEPRSLREALTPAETRVLRYLPTNLTVPEIAGQLYLSVNTVRTHMRHVYDKLGTHRRREAVERARALGLLAPSTLGP